MGRAGNSYDGKLAIDNTDVARVLERIADLLEFNDENPFKVRSYRLASESIEELDDSISERASRGGALELQKIPGIGKSISGQVLEIIQTGTSSYFEQLREATPETVLDLRRVSGVGLKTAQLLYRDFGVKSLEELRAFAEGGGLLSVPGLGEKTAERIKRSLARLESERGLLRLNDATELARSIVDRLDGIASDTSPKASFDKGRIEITGQLRRGREMIDRIDILASGPADELIAAFTSVPQLVEVKTIRPDRVEARADKGTAVVLNIAGADEYAAAMVRTTGSSEHLRDLESIARSLGLRIEGFDLLRESADENSQKRSGRHRRSRGEAVKIETEDDFYNALDLQYIPPELREGLGEVAAAHENRLPRLISIEDIRGDFHLHTTWSDGQNSVREMVEAARFRGYEYIAITDHTMACSIANGNTPEELLEELEEIESMAREFDDIQVLKGAEVDILSDGSLDMPDDVLDRLDWIVCSIHSGFQQERRQITDRVLRAIESGYPDVIAHPTGRLLGERDPYEIDLEEVFQAAKRRNVRLELNASPYRLDLNSYWLSVAREVGVGFVISTDSHRTSGFANMQYGITTARRAWLGAEHVLNTLPLPALLAELERMRASRRG
ncbi:MAG TPA: DNA polymerase/3'-5' exonuclease PolX [Blastocatellia bacterium]|nr:DNA polymerase/3'-5' exonuclease PolX [Blastocatellia bacterium]